MLSRKLLVLWLGLVCIAFAGCPDDKPVSNDSQANPYEQSQQTGQPPIGTKVE